MEKQNNVNSIVFIRLALTLQEREYLETSTAERTREEAAEQARQAHEARLERRARTFLRVLVGVFAVAAIVAGGLALFAFNQARIATSHERAASSVSNLEIAPERSVLLALSALSEARTLEAENALHHALPALHILATLDGHTSNVHDIAYSPDWRSAQTNESCGDRSSLLDTGRSQKGQSEVSKAQNSEFTRGYDPN